MFSALECWEPNALQHTLRGLSTLSSMVCLSRSSKDTWAEWRVKVSHDVKDAVNWENERSVKKNMQSDESTEHSVPHRNNKIFLQKASTIGSKNLLRVIVVGNSFLKQGTPTCHASSSRTSIKTLCVIKYGITRVSIAKPLGDKGSNTQITPQWPQHRHLLKGKSLLKLPCQRWGV